MMLSNYELGSEELCKQFIKLIDQSNATTQISKLDKIGVYMGLIANHN